MKRTTPGRVLEMELRSKADGLSDGDLIELAQACLGIFVARVGRLG